MSDDQNLFSKVLAEDTGSVWEWDESSEAEPGDDVAQPIDSYGPGRWIRRKEESVIRDRQ